MTSVRAYTANGRKWHLLIASGIAACGVTATDDGAPFDPRSAHACKRCANAYRLARQPSDRRDLIELQELGLCE